MEPINTDYLRELNLFWQEPHTAQLIKMILRYVQELTDSYFFRYKHNNISVLRSPENSKAPGLKLVIFLFLKSSQQSLCWFQNWTDPAPLETVIPPSGPSLITDCSLSDPRACLHSWPTMHFPAGSYWHQGGGPQGGHSVPPPRRLMLGDWKGIVKEINKKGEVEKN